MIQLPSCEGGEGVEDDRGGCFWYRTLRTDAETKNNHPLASLAALLRRRAAGALLRLQTLYRITQSHFNRLYTYRQQCYYKRHSTRKYKYPPTHVNPVIEVL